jgi:hypothetical protein
VLNAGLLRGQAQAREIGPHDDISGKPTILGCFPVVSCGKRAARNLEGILLFCSDWRDQMREHQVFRARALCHGSESRRHMPSCSRLRAQAQDRAYYLRLAETLTAFLGRLRSSAETLDVLERQLIVRLLIKYILVGDDAITIRHSIPVATKPPHDGEPPKSSKVGAPKSEGYLLRSGRSNPALRSAELALLAANDPPLPIAIPFLNRRLQPQLYQPQHRAVRNATSYRPEQIFVRNQIMSGSSVGVMPSRVERCRSSEVTGGTAFSSCLSSFLTAAGRSFRRAGPIGALQGCLWQDARRGHCAAPGACSRRRTRWLGRPQEAH